VSAKYPNPTASDLDKHIILAVHGYSATTFEWQEFADWSAPSSSYRISQVLLDGHGRDYGRLKLPHGKTGAPLENMKIRGARIHKN
jgi:carboxylesterase